MLKNVLNQLGELRFSRNHYAYYTTRKPTIQLLLTRIHSNAIFETRTDENVIGFTNGCFTIDYDGDKKGLDYVLMTLEVENISYIAFPSPSRIASGLPKTRVVIPIVGEYTLETYKYQYTQVIFNLGLQNLVDNSVNHVCQYFYPPVMTAIKEPKGADKKPRDYDYKMAKNEIEYFEGEPFRLPTEFTDEALKINLAKKVKDKNGLTQLESVPRLRVFVDDDTMIYKYGEPLASFSEVYKLFLDGKIDDRCDCPFDGKEAHKNCGSDYGIITDGGITCKGHSAKTFVDGREFTHGELILQMKSTQPISENDFEVV